MKNKLLLLSAVICLSGFACANANLTLTDITSPKNPAYRVGISEVPENPYVQSTTKAETLEQTIQNQTAHNSDETTYADLNIKRLSQEIAYDLECDEQQMVSDLSLLWQGAAMQSDTINFALYKLANPEADKPNKSTVKNMLKTIASMSTLVGAGIANPLLAGTSLIGSNVLGIMTQDVKALNYKYSKVTDADMIILIRKVEDLQQKTVDLYYDYMNSKKQLDMATKLATERKQRFELAQKNNVSKELVVITDAYFRTAVDKQKTARSEFLSKRAALEQFVGNEAFTQFEQELADRENPQNETVKEDYNNTISNVEKYTSNLSDSKTASLSGIGYTDDDPNLSKLPPLEPTPLVQEQKVEQEIEQQTEQLAKEVDEVAQEVNNKTEKKVKKAKKEKVKKEKVKEEKPKKVKRNPYDTKGLIFLHDKKPDESNYTDKSAQDAAVKMKNDKKEKVKKEKQVKEVSQKFEKMDNAEIVTPIEQKPKEQKYHGVELLPLDEIKAPDLKPNGYSIFYR